MDKSNIEMKEMMEWFIKNYIEQENEIFKILEIASIENACSMESLYEACLMMKQFNIDKKTSLRSEVCYFAKLSNHGIIGYDAGKMLRDYLTVNEIINEIKLLNIPVVIKSLPTEEKLTIVRRNNRNYKVKPAFMRLSPMHNNFNINRSGRELMQFQDNEKVMFGFNYKEKKAYIFKDDEDDAFILRSVSGDVKGLRFMNKGLTNHFVNCFGLKNNKAYHFRISEKNEKESFELILIDK